ncbi:MAG TPA: sigma-70 family RNA polymerase sigma factor [Terracidiphilus sp.]|nr:sigma-70 family RNA polymerase sigma factor [Terracidiphilus sp.]
MNGIPSKSTCLSAHAEARVRHVEALVAAARAGSSAAFSELCSPYLKSIYRRLYTITKNREDAEDAMQDSLMRAYLGLKDFQGNAQFSTWLMRIAINSALMILRRNRVRREFSYELSPAGEETYVLEVIDGRPDPEQICDQQQRLSRLMHSISRLPLSLRQTAELRMIEDRSTDEVAELLGLSRLAVKTRLHRARLRLARTHNKRTRWSESQPLQETA